MTITRTPDTLAQVGEWVTEFKWGIDQGIRSLRAQFDIEGHDDPLTLFANRAGVYVVEPGCKPVPAGEWLQR